MHHCPECGQQCYCCGDIDDIQAMKQSWAYIHCQCECEDFGDKNYEDEDIYELFGQDDDFWDDEDLLGSKRSFYNAIDRSDDLSDTENPG